MTNHCKDTKQITNTYYALRHGESEGNVLNIATGDPKNGINGYPLTALGRSQVQNTIEAANLPADTIIRHSPFLRTTQTAQIAAEIIGTTAEIDDGLIERYMGDYELQPNAWDNYERMWSADLQDPHHTQDNVESVASMCDRLTACITRLEQQYTNRSILLVSHADPISVLQAVFENIPIEKHHSDVSLPDKAELRTLEWHSRT